jgi:hypothetical protein
MGSFEVETPESTDGLTAGLKVQRQEISSFFGALSVVEFFAPQGDHWSPAGHLRHLAKSVRPLAAAMEVPKMALSVRFGRSRSGSRSFEEVVEIYRSQLAAGAGAGPFSPSDRTPDLSAGDWRLLILERWDQASQQLADALEGWNDKELDKYRLPHPLLGKMTVREMLFFTLYHNAHHARRVVERRSGVGGEK